MDVPTTSAMQIVAVSPPVRAGWKDWLPVISLLLVIGGVLLTGGKTLANLTEVMARVDKLERRMDERDKQSGESAVLLADRLGKMDGKIDLLLERSKERGR